MPNASLRNLLVKLKLRWISCANFRKPLRESAQPNPWPLEDLWTDGDQFSHELASARTAQRADAV